MNTASEFIAHKLKEGHKPNRLIEEKSPYLLQHAFNPVDWYAWDEEAFKKAQTESRPIFLSIGYSTCHWCHVMEHESFECEETAALMNAHFVCIKVDREERPDVDRVYMSAVQALTGSGGWPMSVFLTPDLKPFYGGTYFPPEGKYGRPGFRQILTEINRVWLEQNEKVLASSERITDALQQQLATTSTTQPFSRDDNNRVFEAFAQSFDSVHGGFGDAPKFPRPSVLNFLFHYARQNDNQQARHMALFTLQKMHGGGMFDHLAGGFCRYSVDKYWRVPHFEKMLYDQAQLVNSYLDAFQMTGDTRYAAIARKTLDYVLHDMTAPQGGFYSAEDADSASDPERLDHKTEGAFYLWSDQQIEKLLGPEDAPVAIAHYGIEPGGNTISDPGDEFGNLNVLYAAVSHKGLAKRFNRTEQEINDILIRTEKLLLQTRNQRPRPLRDDKIITSWNGLMISGFARAGAIFQEPRYLEAAERAANFVLATLLKKKDGTLFRRYRDGEARFPGHLDDYAFLLNGLIDLYESGGTIRYLQKAEALAQTMIAHFADSTHGGFFDSASDAKELLFRSKEQYDGAEPSGSSLAILGLARLSRLLDQESLMEIARTAAGTAMDKFKQTPSAYPQLAVALDFILDRPMQVVLAGAPDSKEMQALHAELHTRFLPNKVILHADGGEGQAWLAQKMKAVKTISPINGKAAGYVCENFACKLPTSDQKIFADQLK